MQKLIKDNPFLMLKQKKKPTWELYLIVIIIGIIGFITLFLHIANRYNLFNNSLEKAKYIDDGIHNFDDFLNSEYMLLIASIFILASLIGGFLIYKQNRDIESENLKYQIRVGTYNEDDDLNQKLNVMRLQRNNAEDKNGILNGALSSVKNTNRKLQEWNKMLWNALNREDTFYYLLSAIYKCKDDIEIVINSVEEEVQELGLVENWDFKARLFNETNPYNRTIDEDLLTRFTSYTQSFNEYKAKFHSAMNHDISNMDNAVKVMNELHNLRKNIEKIDSDLKSIETEVIAEIDNLNNLNKNNLEKYRNDYINKGNRFYFVNKTQVNGVVNREVQFVVKENNVHRHGVLNDDREVHLQEIYQNGENSPSTILNNYVVNAEQGNNFCRVIKMSNDAKIVYNNDDAYLLKKDGIQEKSYKISSIQFEKFEEVVRTNNNGDPIYSTAAVIFNANIENQWIDRLDSNDTGIFRELRCQKFNMTVSYKKDGNLQREKFEILKDNSKKIIDSIQPPLKYFVLSKGMNEVALTL